MDVSKYYHIDEQAIQEYLKYESILEISAKWLMRDGHQTFSELQEINKLVQKIQQIPQPKKLYRGVNFNVFSNTVGLPKNPNLGYAYDVTFDVATSFTTEIKVASAFGKTILETVDPIDRNIFLCIPQELSLAVQRKFKFPLPNMHEWVLMKENTTLKIKIIKTKASLGSLKW
ncbi:hypothetical protein PP187_gp267 [Klebsiella phage vB_KvM-Eowyn]|uniref:Uncharacterized protein n=1 Tax=Klebsiella phage vB_KvM-Eowyn TaxID=2762819 RepID=A0A7R8MJS2_9CAUD|nr:hypothetical protein PP187_gp267 [Klebsiella phage vB_KvM-Eowyn]CAD5236256.1 hypothetical protein LLCLJKAH_00267 [Klebsiella phage vB_KvM-Eowyn]